jgi:hypothetical protein
VVPAESSNSGTKPDDFGWDRMLPPGFDRDEVLVCMVIAFGIAAASITTIYRVMS